MELYTSETITDTSNTSTNNELSISFDVDNGGTETVYVEDKLLTNYDVAKARAESILLDEGYVTKRVTFNTYHIDNLHIGDAIQLDGLPFRVINIVEKVQGAKVSMDITAERIPIATSISVFFVTSTTDIQVSVSHSDGYLYSASTNAGEIYRSTNGEVWTLVYNDVSYTWASDAISHSDGYIYVSLHLLGVGSKIMRSIDGVSWTVAFSVLGKYYGKLLSSSSGLFFAPYISSTSSIYKSTNGTDWSFIQDIPYEVTSMCSHNGKLFASAYIYTTEYVSKIYSSVDGAVWTEIHNTNFELLDLTSSGGYMYAVNYYGTIHRSIDGVTWVKVLDNPLYEMYFITSDARGLYASTYSGKIIFSGDGTVWEELYTISPFTSWLWDITSHNGAIYFFDGEVNCYRFIHGE